MSITALAITKSCKQTILFMSSPNGRMDVDRSPNPRSYVCIFLSLNILTSCYRSRNPSTDTHRTRRSHRSTSREKRRRDRGDHEERRKRSRSRDRYRDRDRSRERHGDRDRERDRDRRRERDGERGHRNDRPRVSGDSRHSHRERNRDREGIREREDRDRDKDRRRRRDDMDDSSEVESRSKRKRPDDTVDEIAPPPSSIPPPPPRDSPRADRRDRSLDRKNGDRRTRSPLDPRDEFDDPPRYKRERDGRRLPVDEDAFSIDQQRTKSPPPPIRYVFFFFPWTSLNMNYYLYRRASPVYEAPPEEPYNPDEPKEDDSEARSVFVSQLAARLTARDLGYFFEDKLGEGTVMDSRIVTDRLSRRSKGYVYSTLSGLPQLIAVRQDWLCRVSLH
jgi:RNA-binding protein 23/39